jgi:hypothetical protein
LRGCSVGYWSCAGLGRSLETEALVGSILELARLTDRPAPSIQAVYACVKLLNKVMLTEGGGVAPEQGRVVDAGRTGQCE